MSKKLLARDLHNALRTHYLFCMSLLCMVIILLGGAFALLFSAGSSSSLGLFSHPVEAAQRFNASFDDMSVVGPPSLSADTVNAIFARLGSPMSGTGRVVEQMSQQTSIDDAFALGVWWTETNDGAAGVGLVDRNPGSVRGSAGYPSAYDGYTIYPNYTDAIAYWFHMLRDQYVNRGLTTVYAISHPYVGTVNSPLWAGKVITLMLDYRREAPPPAPVPTILPSPTFSPDLPHHRPFTSGAGLQPGAHYATPAVQPGPPQPVSQQSTLAGSAQAATSSLPRAATWAIVLFALLLALAIALWAVKFLYGARVVGARPFDAHNEHPYTRDFNAQSHVTETLMPLPNIHPIQVLRLPSRPVPAPVASPTSLFAHLPETPGSAKFRRTVLVPSPQDREATEVGPKVAGQMGSRPTGLLARYGQSQQ